MVQAWDGEFERRCNQLIASLCEAGAADSARQAAWRSLLRDVAPHIEAWAGNSWLLAQWRLTSEDDARTVMVNVIARLQRNDFENLRRYAESRGPREEEHDAQLTALTDLARLAASDADDRGAADEPARDLSEGTPLRAWLLTLVRFSTKDYVRQRMGWSVVAGAVATEHGASRRSVATDAARLSDAPEPSARPPITDYLTVRGLLDEVDAFMNSFPADMKAAVAHWMQDMPFAEIAQALNLANAEAARKLVRAGHARLRERFRDRWASFIG